MSKPAMELVRSWRGLHPSEGDVARAVAYKCYPKYSCAMSLTDLQKETKLNRVTISRALGAFELAGWLTRTRRQEPGRGHVETILELNPESRGDFLEDVQRPEKIALKRKSTQLASCTATQLASCPTQLPLVVPRNQLVAPRNQLNKEEESYIQSKKLSYKPPTSSQNPSSSKTPTVRPDDDAHHPPTGTAASKEAPDCRAFVDQVHALCRKIPGSRKGFHLGDRKVAAAWWKAGVSLATIEQALVLGATRRVYRKDGVGLPAAPVSSLKYFAAIVDEVLRQPLPEAQLAYLARKLDTVYSPDQPPAVELSDQAWTMAKKKITVRLDPQMRLFWDKAMPCDVRQGVLTIAAPAEYQEEKHGKRARLIECFREAGATVDDVVFVKSGAEAAMEAFVSVKKARAP